jgi:exodeoxyribonuclease VIII
MLDLETLGNKSDACIVSIGAVQFDINTGELGETFYQNINPSSSLYYGGTVDGDTIMWWLKQSEEARNALQEKPVIALKPALEKFNEFFKRCGKGLRVWGNGCTFDNVIMANAFNKTFVRKPWAYNADCDMRTIVALGKALLGVNIKDYERVGTYHNALDDAKFQAMVVSDIYMKMRDAIGT